MTTSRILACYQTRKTPDFAPTQQFAMDTSGAALLWRLHHDLNPSRREHVERITVRIVGWCFVALAAYVAYDSGSTLIRRQTPARSLPGIVLAAVSLVVMPLLARA